MISKKIRSFFRTPSISNLNMIRCNLKFKYSPNLNISSIRPIYGQIFRKQLIQKLNVHAKVLTSNHTFQHYNKVMPQKKSGFNRFYGETCSHISTFVFRKYLILKRNFQSLNLCHCSSVIHQHDISNRFIIIY